MASSRNLEQYALFLLYSCVVNGFGFRMYSVVFFVRNAVLRIVSGNVLLQLSVSLLICGGFVWLTDMYKYN
jgi:hypothetical protein